MHNINKEPRTSSSVSSMADLDSRLRELTIAGECLRQKLVAAGARGSFLAITAGIIMMTVVGLFLLTVLCAHGEHPRWAVYLASHFIDECGGLVGAGISMLLAWTSLISSAVGLTLPKGYPFKAESPGLHTSAQDVASVQTTVKMNEGILTTKVGLNKLSEGLLALNFLVVTGLVAFLGFVLQGLGGTDTPPSDLHGLLSSNADGLILYGVPEVDQTVGKYYILRHKAYVTGYDAGRLDPLWVETRLFPGVNSDAAGRKAFVADPEVEPEDAAKSVWWTNSEYDRGHMARNSDIYSCYGPDAQGETFFTTNILPQRECLNRFVWKELEEDIFDEYAPQYGQVWVICGPIFGNKSDTLPVGKVYVPEKCYKIVLRVDKDGTPHVLGFEMPQNVTRKAGDLQQYLCSVAKIEADTGITFFPLLPVQTRDNLVEQTPQTLWP